MKSQPQKWTEIVASCTLFNLRKASRAVTRLYDQQLAPSGLRATQLTMLLGVAMGGGRMTVSRLSQLLVMDRTTLTRSLTPLVRDGLIAMAGVHAAGGDSLEAT